jgi:hypothetical protein
MNILQPMPPSFDVTVCGAIPLCAGAGREVRFVRPLEQAR